MPDPKPASSGSSKGGGNASKGGNSAKGGTAAPESSRFTMWLVTTLALWALWFGFIQPAWFPNQNAAPQQPVVLKDEGESPRGFLADADRAAADRPAAPPADGAAEDADAAADAPPAWEPNPRQSVTLGGLTAAAAKRGYYTQVELTSRGAAVERITLSDGRYRELANRNAPLKVIGNGDAVVRTFQTRIDALDAALRRQGADSLSAHWALTGTTADPDDPEVLQAATFTLTAPDGSFEAVKTYRLRKGAPDESPEDVQREGARDSDPRGYMLDLDLTLRNLSPGPRKARFTVQGPVGLPLENEENTRKYRDIELAYFEDAGELETTYLSSADATEAVKKLKESLAADADIRGLEETLANLQRDFDVAEVKAEANPDDADAAAAVTRLQARIAAAEAALAAREEELADVGALAEYRKPLRYVGTEVQYFAALLFPRTGASTPAPALADAQDDDGLLPGLGDVYDAPVIDSAVPQVTDEPDPSQTYLNDISVRLTSAPVEVPAAAGAGEDLEAGEATRSFTLFAGPKRLDLLEPLGAGEVMDLGWFGVIGGGMLWFMTQLHDLGFPYWLAIISLTVCVRLLMFPLSKRTALMAAKQKALAPKIAEIKKRCGDDAQAAGREQWALMNKYGVNPLMGCLPVFFTIPVFIALYNALLNSVDLRLAEFLWIDNLAAPDNLFLLPFRIPYLGWYLNVLPVALAALWFFQQKLFMPPAQTPEQEMQYKLMGYMMPLSALFIYHLPAGWCLYSIASAVWTLTERKLLDRTRNAQLDPEEDLTPRRKGPVGRAVGRITEKPMARLKEKIAEAQAAAEAAQAEATNQQLSRRDRGARNGRPAPNSKAARRAAGGGGKKKSKR
ncbi:membrane protein insertase YidC [Alienimonas californiensis]|uniref:Membrane protein insertase YidC n=1 Tax=Alienimonas californiensis TaxID=2527989 RepID=A0A517P5N7_9PLAN|nr:membrane protein insertase YidC [Alienimonas californiensis]QDT14687.1 Membrane protein insertase YidC [Alienimonas californiensis]